MKLCRGVQEISRVVYIQVSSLSLSLLFSEKFQRLLFIPPVPRFFSLFSVKKKTRSRVRRIEIYNFFFLIGKNWRFNISISPLPRRFFILNFFQKFLFQNMRENTQSCLQHKKGSFETLATLKTTIKPKLGKWVRKLMMGIRHREKVIRNLFFKIYIQMRAA